MAALTVGQSPPHTLCADRLRLFQVILLLMTMKKTINVYVIFKWLSDFKNDHADSSMIEHKNEQYVSMGLLATHFVVGLYVMLAPKLARSQNDSNFKGGILLTIALIGVPRRPKSTAWVLMQPGC